MSDQMLEEVMKCEGFINSFAHKYSYYHDFEDLQQVGKIALEKALRKYDPTSRATFSSYAFLWIKGEILEYVRKDKAIVISKEMQSLSFEIDRCTELLKQGLGRSPDISEIALALNKEEYQIIEAIQSREFVRSADYSVNENDEKEINIYDLMPYQEMGYNAEFMDLHQAIEMLPEPEKSIIKLRYFKDMTQSETSKIIGINQVGVSRYEKKATEKLKKLVA